MTQQTHLEQLRTGRDRKTVGLADQQTWERNIKAAFDAGYNVQYDYWNMTYYWTLNKEIRGRGLRTEADGWDEVIAHMQAHQTPDLAGAAR